MNLESAFPQKAIGEEPGPDLQVTNKEKGMTIKSVYCNLLTVQIQNMLRQSMFWVYKYQNLYTINHLAQFIITNTLLP